MNITKEINKKEFLFYLLVAYIFGVFIRLLVFNNIIGIDSYWFEGRPIPIWSDDAGLYGYYAKEILKGVSYPFSGDYILSYIIAFVVKLTHLHIDWVMFVLPAFLASLVVIPVIITGYILNRVQFSFFVAIIGVVGVNYYTRSYLGYMDTDGINIFLIYSFVLSLMVVIYKNELKYSIYPTLFLLFFLEFYHSSKSLLAGVLIGYLVVGVIFYIKEKIIYQIFITLSLAFIIGIKFGFLIALSSAIIVNIIFLYEKKFDYKAYLLVISLSIIGVLLFFDLSSIYSRVLDYFNLNSLVTMGEYKITNVLSTVAEVQQRGIFAIYDNFIGVKYYVIIATIGYFILVYKHREFIFLLPLLILGYMSFKIGIRFTMYSSFVLAFGFVYLLYLFKHQLIIYLGVILAIGVMFYNILGINSYIKPKYFFKDELKLFQNLKITQNDKLISWWDYGWPLWYYTGNRNTYIDNGLNNQGGTIFVSKMLLSIPKEASKLAKIISTDIRDLSILENQNSIDKKAKSIQPTKDIYIMLHKNMLRSIKTISKFGDRDIKSGKLNIHRTIESLSYIIKKRYGKYYTTNFIINTKTGTIKDKKSNMAKLNQIIVIQKGKIRFSKVYNIKSDINVIIADRKAIYIDNKTLKTLFITSLLLNKNSKYFQKVIETKKIKVLKLN